MILEPIINKIIAMVTPVGLVNLLLCMLDGQTFSGYGGSVTFQFPKEKREEIIKEAGLNMALFENVPSITFGERYKDKTKLNPKAAEKVIKDFIQDYGDKNNAEPTNNANEN